MKLPSFSRPSPATILILATGGIGLAFFAQLALRSNSILAAILLFILALAWAAVGLRDFSFFTPAKTHAMVEGKFPPAAVRLGLASVGLTLVCLLLFEGDQPGLSAWLIYLVAIGAVIVASFNQAKTADGEARAPLRTGVLLALILALAFFMRVYLLGFYPFGTWYDEADYGNTARQLLFDPQGVFPLYLRGGYDAPAHFMYLIVLSFRIFGVSTFSLRLVSVVFGVATVAAGYLAGRELVDRRFGLIVAFLLAVSRWDVNFSRLGMHCITTPFFTLLTVGLLLRALRRGRWSDYAWSGVSLGLGFSFYTAFRLFPLVIALFLVVYFLTRGDIRQAIRAQWRGLAFFALGALIAAGPVLEFAVVHADVFWERTQEVSLIANTPADQLSDAVLGNTAKHLLMFNYKGDSNGRHNLPGEPMLDNVTAALLVLGLGLCLLRLRKPQAVLLVAWLVVMLLPGILSLDFEAPQSLRSIGALPAAILMAGIPFYAGVELWGKSLPHRWSGWVWLPAGLLLLQIGSANFDVYFNRQVTNTASWSAFSTSETLAAQVMNTYGSGYTYYVSSIYDGSPTIAFLAPQISGYHILETNDHLPIQMDTSQGAIFLLDPDRVAIEDQLKRIYPQAEFKRYLSPDGRVPYLLTAVITHAQVTQIQGLVAHYSAEGGDTPQVKTRKVDQLQEDWSASTPLPLPFHAEWSGVLYAPTYGTYHLRLEAPAQVSLSLDDETLLDGSGPQEVDTVLAHGAHSIQVEAEGGNGQVTLSWTPPQGSPAVVPDWALFTPPVTNNGLLGKYYPNGDWTPPAALEEVAPELNLYFHRPPLNRPYTVEWTGYIRIDQAGSYVFGLNSVDESSLTIDGVDLFTAPSMAYTEGSLDLQPGFHTLLIRFADRTSHTGISFYWLKPDGEQGLVPQDVLYLPTTDIERAGAQIDLTAAANTGAAGGEEGDGRILWQTGSPGSGPEQFDSPRGLSVDSQGNLYVADAGNHRVVKLARDGSFVGLIGAEDGLLDEPAATAITSAGELVVLDADQPNWLQRFDLQGVPLGSIPTEITPYHPRGLAVGAQDSLLVADTGDLQLLRLSSSGALLDQWGGSDSSIGQGQPVSIGEAPDGSVYWLEASSGVLSRRIPEGPVQALARISPTDTLAAPQLAIDPQGNLYFSDPENGRIYGMDPNGQIFFQMSSAAFPHPTGIAIGPDGILYVVDPRLCQVVAVAPNPQ